MCFFIFSYYNWLLYFPINRNFFWKRKFTEIPFPPQCIFKICPENWRRYALCPVNWLYAHPPYEYSFSLGSLSPLELLTIIYDGKWMWNENNSFSATNIYRFYPYLMNESQIGYLLIWNPVIRLAHIWNGKTWFVNYGTFLKIFNYIFLKECRYQK